MDECKNWIIKLIYIKYGNEIWNMVWWMNRDNNLGMWTRGPNDGGVHFSDFGPEYDVVATFTYFDSCICTLMLLRSYNNLNNTTQLATSIRWCFMSLLELMKSPDSNDPLIKSLRPYPPSSPVSFIFLLSYFLWLSHYLISDANEEIVNLLVF